MTKTRFQQIVQGLEETYKAWQGHAPDQVVPLKPSGSAREYYRLSKGQDNCIGVYNEDLAENKAFFDFSLHFQKMGLPVPRLLFFDYPSPYYFLEDMGDRVLFDELVAREDSPLPEGLLSIYRQTVRQLVRFQVEAHEGFPYASCYPVAAFDQVAIRWDLDYFKYYFLKLFKAPFHEKKLEGECYRLSSFLANSPYQYFMYRDFQSRNVILRDEKPYFIDYQGGRKGPVLYDLASLLYQARARLTGADRESLYGFYKDEMAKYIPVDDQRFREDFTASALVRVMQTLGAYGFRGFHERKPHFMKSMGLAFQNLARLLQAPGLPVQLPHLKEVVENLPARPFDGETPPAPEGLQVNLMSFSYKKGIPADSSEHGGGFVFDCRFLPNPGRYHQYQAYTGLDEQVIEFFKDKSEMHDFLDNTKAILSDAVENYLQRGFKHLSIFFGCTGGQHRSVFAARQIGAWLKETYPVLVKSDHRELSKLDNTG
jgi:aminoglycoside/choline kinase family phosphotransferase